MTLVHLGLGELANNHKPLNRPTTLINLLGKPMAVCAPAVNVIDVSP